MPVKLTAADIEKLKSKELANAIRKLHAGKTLTNAERALIATAGVESSTAATNAGGFAPNWNELAERLGVSRKAIQNWRKDDRYKDDYPKERADGRHDITAWAEFMVRHGLKRADEFTSTPGTSGDDEEEILGVKFPPGCEADWKKALLAERVEGQKRENAKAAGTLLVAAELEAPLGATLVAVTNKLTQFPERAAPLVTGFSDVLEVIEILRTEVEADLTILHAADYLADVDQLVTALPTDAETTRLLQLVSFAGQDHAALLQLIAHCTKEALRRVGARAIGAAVAPPIAHVVTGQVTDAAEAEQSGGKNAGEALSAASCPPPPAASLSGPRKPRSYRFADSSNRTTGKPSNRGKPYKDCRRGASARKRRVARKAKSQ